jgi:hypothetical protein
VEYFIAVKRLGCSDYLRFLARGPKSRAWQALQIYIVMRRGNNVIHKFLHELAAGAFGCPEVRSQRP